MNSFAKKVYRAVSSIPLGEVRTYKWLAKKVGKPRSVRAIGQILKHNPYPLFIPSHRIICSDGSLGGYIFGKKKKRTLLDLEKRITKDVV